MGNKQRIIDAAVELMNKNGSTVGTTQLTEHLSISPGNLYYLSLIHISEPTRPTT